MEQNEMNLRTLARCYERGEEVLQDLCVAAELYRKAFERGERTAGLNLGDCYFRGAGVPQDYQKAIEYYRKSDTIRGLSIIRHFFQEEKLIRKPNLKYFPGLERAALEGKTGACTAMGNLFFLGKVGYTDYREGAQWYVRAGEDPEALFCMGYAHAVGAGVPQDIDRAVEYFRSAGRQEFLPAYYNLLVCTSHKRYHRKNTMTDEEVEQAHQFMELAGKLNGTGYYTPKDHWIRREMDKITFLLNRKEEITDTEKEEE